MPFQHKLFAKASGKGKVQVTPFKITLNPDKDNPSITVNPGTINQLLPTNIFEKIPVASLTKSFVKLKCSTNGRTPTACEIVVTTTPVETTDVVKINVAPPAFEVILGVIIDSKAHNVVYTNLSATPAVAFKEGKAPERPGAEPFVRWWYWLVVGAVNRFYYAT